MLNFKSLVYIIKFYSLIELARSYLFRLYLKVKNSWGEMLEKYLRDVIGN